MAVIMDNYANGTETTLHFRPSGAPTPEGSAHEPIRSNGPRYYQHIRLELPIHLSGECEESLSADNSDIPSDSTLGGLWIADHAFRVVHNLVSDCRSLCKFDQMSVDMDYEDSFPDATISVDIDAVARSPLIFPSVTCLRLAGRSFAELGTQRPLFEGLATTFPNLRALAVASSV
ncbi:hypothetical protein BD309DRAFT_862466 [Dichomitus squalens]|nr:hypothetical protein BD309DRAFT_862466 [Dichomitus squalens]